MSQTIFSTIVPSTTSGNQLATILNDFKNALVSGCSGTSRPSALQAGGCWVDTTNDGVGTWDLKIYDGTQDITVFIVNKNTGVVSPTGAEGTFTVRKTSADSVSPILKLLKKRIANAGQTIANDPVGEVAFTGHTDAGVEVEGALIRVTASENHTATAHGSKISIRNKKPGQTSHTTQIEIEEFVTIKTTLTVDGNVTAPNLADKTSAQTLTNKTIVAANNTITTAAVGSIAATELNAVIAEIDGDLVSLDSRLDALEAVSDVKYFGDANTNGSWRIYKDGTDLKVQIRVAGVWTTKDTFTP